jgi:hypothetical protein
MGKKASSVFTTNLIGLHTLPFSREELPYQPVYWTLNAT